MERTSNEKDSFSLCIGVERDRICTISSFQRLNWWPYWEILRARFLGS
jgi:hypothetical protein